MMKGAVSVALEHGHGEHSGDTGRAMIRVMVEMKNMASRFDGLGEIYGAHQHYVQRNGFGQAVHQGHGEDGGQAGPLVGHRPCRP